MPTNPLNLSQSFGEIVNTETFNTPVSEPLVEIVNTSSANVSSAISGGLVLEETANESNLSTMTVPSPVVAAISAKLVDDKECCKCM